MNLVVVSDSHLASHSGLRLEQANKKDTCRGPLKFWLLGVEGSRTWPGAVESLSADIVGSIVGPGGAPTARRGRWENREGLLG